MNADTDVTIRTARAVAAASLDSYEAAVRALTELERTIGRGLPWGALGSVAAACADLTRDATAVQLSTARWILDL